jgi:hypothetical protein
MTDTQRYWDGAKWTDHIAPSAPMAHTPADSGEGIVIAGWVMAFVLPIGGAIIGVMLAGDPRQRSVGLGMTFVSILAGLVWYAAIFL